MAITRKLRQKVCDGSLREMRQEAKWIFAYIRRYRAAVGIHILLGILGTALSLLSSVAMKTLIDVVTGFETGAIWSAAAWMAGLLLGSAAMQAAASRIAAIVDIRVQNGIQVEVYDCILRTDWVSLEQFRSGDLLNRLNTDVGAVAGGVTGLLPSFVSAAVQFLGSLIIILCYDPVMALIALIGAPLSVLCSRTLVHRMRGYNRRMKDISSEVMSFHEDSLRNLTSVKAFGIMDGFRDRMCAMQEKYRETYLDYNRFSVVAGFVMSVVGLLVSAGCFGWGAYRLWTHAISYGAMMMFLQLTTMLRSAFSALIGLVPSAISITTSAGRLMAIADLPEEPGARETAPIPTPCTVELRDVTFAYPGGEPVLEHVDFHAAPGEVVALTGPSGEGKTTMIRLMLGLIRPAQGSVSLTGATDSACRLRPRRARPSAMCRRATPSLPVRSPTTCAWCVRRQRMRSSSLRSRPPARMILCPSCRTASMPARVSSVTACPRDRRSASLWPAPCCAARRCCCSMRPPARSTRPPSGRCSKTSCAAAACRRACSSRTALRQPDAATAAMSCTARACASRASRDGNGQDR